MCVSELCDLGRQRVQEAGPDSPGHRLGYHRQGGQPARELGLHLHRSGLVLLPGLCSLCVSILLCQRRSAGGVVASAGMVLVALQEQLLGVRGGGEND